MILNIYLNQKKSQKFKTSKIMMKMRKLEKAPWVRVTYAQLFFITFTTHHFTMETKFQKAFSRGKPMLKFLKNLRM